MATKSWADRVAAVLSGTEPPEDPSRVQPASRYEKMPAQMRSLIEQGLTPAGVLMPLLLDASRETLVLTRRADTLKHHQGQVSFPGGSLEASDSSITDAALRETEEEIGIVRTRVSIIGYLPTQPTITGFAVTPVVGRIDGPVEFTRDPVEVAEVFEVPLAFLFEGDNMGVSERLIGDVSIPVYEWHYANQHIWGATAAMVKQLVDLTISENK